MTRRKKSVLVNKCKRHFLLFFMVFVVKSLKTDAQIKIGIGRSAMFQNNYSATPELRGYTKEFYLKELNDVKGTHFSLQRTKLLKKRRLISIGINVDYSKFTIRTYGVPDNTFANSKLFYDQAQFLLDIPFGFGIYLLSDKKPLLLQAGISAGAFFNPASHVRYDIYTPDQLYYRLNYATQTKHTFSFTSSLWLQAQYKLFRYNCLSPKGLWLEGQIKQTLQYNTERTLKANFETPAKNYVYNYRFQNRPFMLSLSCLFDL